MTERSGTAATPVLLLDVMGTLVFDPFYERVPAFFEMTFEQLLREKHPTAWIEFELGQIDEPTFLPRFFRDGRSYDQEGLKAAMRGNYAWLPGMEDLVAELAGGGCELHAFSNYTPWYQMIEQRTNLSRFVHWSFVSCDTGLRKPDPTAYINAARSLGVTTEACLFVDDRPRNCDAAIEVGMPSIVFESAEQLRSELIARGALKR